MFAKVASFYSWEHEYICNLPASVFIEYYESITVIEARDNLVKMSITDYPQMKTDGRKRLHKQMYKLANPKHLREEMSFEDFARTMSGKRKS